MSKTSNLDYSVEQQNGGTELDLAELEEFCERLRAAGAPSDTLISLTSGDYFRLVGAWSL